VRSQSDGAFGTATDEDFVTTIFHASGLHDVGKVGITDAFR